MVTCVLQEYIILTCNEESAEFHNILALQYKEKLHSLMGDYLQTMPEGGYSSYLGMCSG